MGSRRTNPVVGLDYNFVSSLFLDAANSLQFFSSLGIPSLSLSLILARFPFIFSFLSSPPFLLEFYQQVRLRENEFLRHITRLLSNLETGVISQKKFSSRAFASQLPRNFLLRADRKRLPTSATSESSWRSSAPFIIYVLTRAISTTLDFHAFNCAWCEFSFESLPISRPPFLFSFRNVYKRNLVSKHRYQRERISSVKWNKWRVSMSQCYANYVYTYVRSFKYWNFFIGIVNRNFHHTRLQDNRFGKLF